MLSEHEPSVWQCFEFFQTFTSGKNVFYFLYKITERKQVKIHTETFIFIFIFNSLFSPLLNFHAKLPVGFQLMTQLSPRMRLAPDDEEQGWLIHR
jgi:hypothetical protein